MLTRVDGGVLDFFAETGAAATLKCVLASLAPPVSAKRLSKTARVTPYFQKMMMKKAAAKPAMKAMKVVRAYCD